MNERKKMLFIINNMEIGGTRSSLLNLLSYIDKKTIEIHLVLLSPFGPYMEKIPSSVKILPESFFLKCCFSKKENLNFFEKIVKGVFHGIRMITGYNRLFSIIFKLTTRKLSDNNYDAVIGFQEGESNDCASFIRAKSVSLWIHNDYDNLIGNGRGIPVSYQTADNIFFVADASMNNFKKAYPQYTSKCQVIRNTLDIDVIRKRAEENVDVNFNDCQYNIISVGRVTNQKRFDRVIEAASVLKNRGFKFRWYIIGDGILLEQLKKSIREKKVSDIVVLLGAKKNPYPYISKASLLVVTSDYESQPMVILESMALGVPVITTRFASAVELAMNSKGAVELVDISVEAIVDGVSKSMNVHSLALKKSILKEFSYDNEGIIADLLERVGVK